jgi:cupin fold WbuC family metalloprotein
MKLIKRELFNTLHTEANESSRKRAHFNLHAELSDSVQRLCVSVNPGSYIRPHRHSAPDKWELFLVLQGSAAILTFDDNGCVTEKFVISNRGPIYGAEIPSNTWHTIAAREINTILVEIKPGPYSPTAQLDFASWAPQEGAAESSLFEKRFRSAEVGSISCKGDN